jgi:hypothetical protein
LVCGAVASLPPCHENETLRSRQNQSSVPVDLPKYLAGARLNRAVDNRLSHPFGAFPIGGVVHGHARARQRPAPLQSRCRRRKALRSCPKRSQPRDQSPRSRCGDSARRLAPVKVNTRCGPDRRFYCACDFAALLKISVGRGSFYQGTPSDHCGSVSPVHRGADSRGQRNAKMVGPFRAAIPICSCGRRFFGARYSGAVDCL